MQEHINRQQNQHQNPGSPKPEPARKSVAADDYIEFEEVK